jgi:hypothetical protein
MITRPLKMAGDTSTAPKPHPYNRPDGSFDWEALAEARRARILLLLAILHRRCATCGHPGPADPDAGQIDPCADPRALAHARAKRIIRLNQTIWEKCPGCGTRGEVPP